MSAPTASTTRRSVATTRQPTTPAATRQDRRVLLGVVVLAALSVGGAIISVAGGLSSTIAEATGPSGRLSIPIPMMLAQLAVAWLASGRRRRLALLASAMLVLVEPICIVSGFFDGGYTDPDRSPFEVAYQLLFIAAIAVVGMLAALRLSSLLRRRA